MNDYDKLGFSEIAQLVGQLGLTTNIKKMFIDNIEVDGKKYTYEKTGNQLRIRDENGKGVDILIDYSKETKEKDDMTTETIMKHEVFIDYLLASGNLLSFYNNIGLYEGYRTFENVARDSLVRGIRTFYCDQDGKELANFSGGDKKICLKDTGHTFEFTDKGIEWDKKVVSADGNVLISIKDEPVENIEDYYSFDIEKERVIFKDIIEQFKEKAHKFTLEELETILTRLERRDRNVKGVIEICEKDLPEARRAIQIRNEVRDAIDNNCITPEVLRVILFDYIARTKDRQDQPVEPPKKLEKNPTSFGRPPVLG